MDIEKRIFQAFVTRVRYIWNKKSHSMVGETCYFKYSQSQFH